MRSTLPSLHQPQQLPCRMKESDHIKNNWYIKIIFKYIKKLIIILKHVIVQTNCFVIKLISHYSTKDLICLSSLLPPCFLPSSFSSFLLPLFSLPRSSLIPPGLLPPSLLPPSPLSPPSAECRRSVGGGSAEGLRKVGGRSA